MLSARPVSEKRPRRNDKPKTAKEALQARAQQRRGDRPVKRDAKVAPSRPRDDAREQRPGEARNDSSAAEDEVQETEEQAVAKPVGMWQRIKRLFGR